MIGRRLLYLAVLLGAGVLHVCYGQYFSYILFLSALALPALSFVISLPAMLTCYCSLHGSSAVERGRKAFVTLETGCRFLLPAGAVTLRISGENRFTGEKLPLEKMTFWGVQKEKRSIPLITKSCGAVKCRLEKVRVWDYLGLFAIPVKKGDEVTVLVLPVPVSPQKEPELQQDSALCLKPKPGGGYSEEHELRPYRQGDAINSIHWKLSSKWGETIVREPQLMKRKRVTLSVSPASQSKGLENQLDQLLYLSRKLIKEGIPFTVRFDGRKPAVITGEGALQELFLAILASPPQKSPALPTLNKQDELIYCIKPEGVA